MIESRLSAAGLVHLAGCMQSVSYHTVEQTGAMSNAKAPERVLPGLRRILLLRFSPASNDLHRCLMFGLDWLPSLCWAPNCLCSLHAPAALDTGGP